MSSGENSGRDIDRRGMLVGLGAAAAAMGAINGLAAEIEMRGFTARALAQAPAPGGATTPAAVKPHRIDVHHHFSPPQWIAEVKGNELLQRANADWTPARSIEDMDKAGVAVSVVSITNPGLWFGDTEVTKRISRACNDYGAKLVSDHKGRFGLFAALPMPDVEATLKEIGYAFDTLKVDGAHLFTSYGDSWLGNKAYDAVLAELNRRKAVVHVHPTAANCCKNLIPDVREGVIEYGHDTTRAIVALIFSGAAARFPDIRWIWSHAGGTAPFLAGRIEANAQRLKDAATRMPRGAIHELKRFHYDVAGAANEGALASLLKLVSPDRVLFGTDFPPAGPSANVVQALSGLGFGEADLKAIERGNALRLMPQFG